MIILIIGVTILHCGLWCVNLWHNPWQSSSFWSFEWPFHIGQAWSLVSTLTMVRTRSIYYTGQPPPSLTLAPPPSSSSSTSLQWYWHHDLQHQFHIIIIILTINVTGINIIHTIFMGGLGFGGGVRRFDIIEQCHLTKGVNTTWERGLVEVVQYAG